jgi:cell division transport system permease protein
MKLRTVGRHTRDGFRNLFRNGWMTFAAVSAVAVTLFILGAAMILSMNIQNMVTNIEGQLQVNAYVSASIPAKDLPSLRRQLEALPDVARVQFVSKQAALVQMRKMLQNNANLLDGLGNPLPNEFIVQAKHARLTAYVASEVEAVPGIAKVDYGASFIGKFLSVTTAVRDTAIAFIIVLIVMGVFLISNTIKITIFTRRREIEIMKLVGATDGFIRGPFLIEGTLMGLIGAALPAFVLYEVYRWLAATVTLFPPFSLLPLADVFGRMALVLVLCGLFMGAWGSFVSIRRFLRV